MTRLLSFICLLLLAAGCKNNSNRNARKQNLLSGINSTPATVGKNHIAEATTFVQQRHYNDAVCFFINLSIPSGQKRFLVYNLKADSIIASGLVAHGSCNTSFLKDAAYSNTIGSGCSSTGKYKVGHKYQGRFGTAYKLYGLDSSNSNAFKRAVVLHKYACVPEDELPDAAICNSLGCPMVAPKFFERLSAVIDNSEKPVLLWIY